LGGESGHFMECGQRRGECLPVVWVELAGQGGQATDALLSPRLDHFGTGGRDLHQHRPAVRGVRGPHGQAVPLEPGESCVIAGCVTRSLAVSSDSRIGPLPARVCRTPKVVKLICSTDARRMNTAVNCSMARTSALTGR
jgi:hypothetical protein